MRRIRNDNLIKRTANVLGNNEGASLVLVSIFAILVIAAVVILRLATTTFMASANRQLNQDQAYELAASLGSSIDELITAGKYDLDSVTSGTTAPIVEVNGFTGLPAGSSVVARFDVDNSKNVKILIVTAKVGQAQYVYTKEYYA